MRSILHLPVLTLRLLASVASLPQVLCGGKKKGQHVVQPARAS